MSGSIFAECFINWASKTWRDRSGGKAPLRGLYRTQRRTPRRTGRVPTSGTTSGTLRAHFGRLFGHTSSVLEIPEADPSAPPPDAALAPTAALRKGHRGTVNLTTSQNGVAAHGAFGTVLKCHIVQQCIFVYFCDHKVVWPRVPDAASVTRRLRRGLRLRSGLRKTLRGPFSPYTRDIGRGPPSPSAETIRFVLVRRTDEKYVVKIFTFAFNFRRSHLRVLER